MRRSAISPALASGFLLLWLSAVTTGAAGLPPSPEVELVSNATLLFRRAVGTPSAAIPASVMRRAQALAAFPGAVIDGTTYCGVGIVSARGVDAVSWTPPAVVALQGEIPVELDVEPVDFMLVALTPKGVAYLEQPSSRLTGRYVIEPGPLGQDTPTKIDADLLGYMTFDDLFAGITLSEVSIAELKDANARIYGTPLSTTGVFRTGFRVPVFAQLWRNAIASYFREMS